jgi:hypothetical protein
MHDNLRHKANIAQIYPLDPSIELAVSQVICVTEWEVCLGQKLCMLKEFQNQHNYTVEAQYAQVKSISYWWEPYVNVQLEFFDPSGYFYLEDCFILCSCFSTPPHLIEFSHSGTEPYEYFLLTSYFWKN